MTVAEYFQSIQEHLVIASFVAEFKIIRQVDRSRNGYIRSRVTFTANSRLEFSEFVEQNAQDDIRVVTYSYHWADENETLICRWDNTPHFPNPENAPHHLHMGAEQVLSGQPVDIFGVLNAIEKKIEN